MNMPYQPGAARRAPTSVSLACGLLLGCSLSLLGTAHAQTRAVDVTKGNTTSSTGTVTAAGNDFSVMGSALELSMGKSSLMRMPSPVQRIAVGNPDIVDISLINPSQVYMLGKNFGSTNLTIWRKDGTTMVVDVSVNMDAERMEKKLRQLMPEETGIKVFPAADSVILTGLVSSAPKAKYAEDIAGAYLREISRSLSLPVVAGDARVASGTVLGATGAGSGGGGSSASKVVNLLRVTQGQQVMLEVKVAEVSKVLLERLGVNFSAAATTSGLTYGILSNLFSSTGILSITREDGKGLSVDANRSDTLVKVLAEPNIIAMSGQEASFLAGGRLFIPVISSAGSGTLPTVSLEEREYGVGVKFTPTVLDGGRINLKVAPEVSDIGKGTSFKIGGVETILPNFTTNHVQTTVQLMDGQSLAIAGLIKNNVGEVVSRVPLLGDIPILGTLFRSSEFQNNRTELVFLITPRLIKPLPEVPRLPTDSFVPPSYSEFFFEGRLEGSGNAQVPADKPLVVAAPVRALALPVQVPLAEQPTQPQVATRALEPAAPGEPVQPSAAPSAPVPGALSAAPSEPASAAPEAQELVPAPQALPERMQTVQFRGDPLGKQ